MQETTETASEANTVANEAPLLDRLRKLILSGDYPPGALLPELFLAQEFNVSRTPIREALKQIEQEGLVEIRPRVGTFVRQPTRREIVELFELKGGLEGLAAGLFARRGAVPELEVLRRNVEESRRAVRSGDANLRIPPVPEFGCELVETNPIRGNESFSYSHHKRLVELMLEEARVWHPELEQVVFRISTILGETVDNQITAEGKHVVVLGGGDTGADCIGTAHRQKALSVTNLAIGFLAEPAIAELIRGPLEATGMPAAGVHPTAIGIALLAYAGRRFGPRSSAFAANSSPVASCHRSTPPILVPYLSSGYRCSDRTSMNFQTGRRLSFV